jgi:hypothetical protein
VSNKIIDSIGSNNNLENFEQICEKQLNTFSEKFNLKTVSNCQSDTSLERINRKMSFNTNGKASRIQDIKRKKTLFNNPVVQMLKNLTVIS